MKTKTAILGLLMVGICSGFSQGFMDLNFEDATIVPVPSSPYYPSAVYANEAIPGWTVTGVTFLPTNQILYNNLSLGSFCVALLSASNSVAPSLVIDGNYSINLYNNVSISQTGLVPANAVSILFKAQGNESLGALVLSLGGQNVPYFALATGSNYTLYGADISGFANQTENLMFYASYGENSDWSLDDIQFSSMPVPEPSIWSLFIMWGLFLGWKRLASTPANR